MRATDQIESLSLMAIDPVAKTVVPRFWAAIIGMPLLCGFFCTFAIVAGYLEAGYVLGLDPGYFSSALKVRAVLAHDLIIAFAKFPGFGLIGSVMAPYTDFLAEPTIQSTPVGQTTGS